MSKAQEIVHSFYIKYQIQSNNLSNDIEMVEKIIERKCQHPNTSIIAICGKKSNWKCSDCGSEVIAIKYEAVK